MQTVPRKLRLLDEIGTIDRLGDRLEKAKGFLHVHSHYFWKAGCQDSVSRSSRREALSASFPSRA